MRKIVLALALLTASLPAMADSMNFTARAYQNGGFQSVDLGNGLSPLVGPTFNPWPGLGPDLVVGIIYKLKGPVTYSADVNIIGRDITSGPYTFNCPVTSSYCGLLVDFVMPTLYKPTEATFTANVNGELASYDFQYAQPVPEPASLLLVGAGVLALCKIRRAGDND